MEIKVEAPSDLAGFMPPSGTVCLKDGSKVKDLLDQLKIDHELIMLIVIDGELADMETTLADGAAVELIPPISGG